MTNIVCNDWLKDRTNQQEMSNASMALMEEVKCEFRKDDGKFMVKEFTKDSDVKEASKREEDKIIHTHNSWMENIIMLMSFLFFW